MPKHKRVEPGTVLKCPLFAVTASKSLARRQHCFVVISMAVIHCCLIGGLTFSVTLFSHTFELPEQWLALLSLIPIWFYRGKQGIHNRGVRALFYGFYPVHMLILALLMLCLYK